MPIAPAITPINRPVVIMVFHCALDAIRAAVGPSEIHATADSRTYSNFTFSSLVTSRSKEDTADNHAEAEQGDIEGRTKELL